MTDSTPSFSHTMEYHHIDQALRSNWSNFNTLRAEMNSFQPRALDSFQDLYNSELERIKALNPKSMVEDIERLVRGQIEAQARPDWQFFQAFDARLMTQYVTVVMLSHALCEALINAALAVGLARANTTDLFQVLDKADFKQKWLTAPKALLASYEFPKSNAIYESLVKLARQRNSLVHHKVQLHVNGVKALEGSGFERRTYAEELSWLNRFFSLPYDLADFLRKELSDQVHGILFDRRPIERAPEHTPIYS
jgi:hypothetical protein